MKLRPRTADILLVLGLVALVAWTPTYFAQSTEERALLDGERFLLREVRDGDRMDLELLVTWPNGTSFTSGPLVTVEYEAAEEDAPPGAAFVEHRTFQRTHVAFGGAMLAIEARDRLTWYDEDYRAVWADATGVGDAVVSYPGNWHGRWPSHPPLDDAHVARQGDWGNWDRLWNDRAQPLWYERSSDLRSVLDFWRSDPAEQTDDTPMAESAHAGSIEDQYRVHGIYRHQDQALYAANIRETGWGPYAAPPLTKWTMGYRTFDMMLQFEEGVPRDGGSRSWDWYVRDFPTKVGMHHEFFDAEGNPHVALDLVPTAIQRGRTTFEGEAEGSVVESRASAPVRSWRDDAAPIIGGVSAAGLMDRLGSDAAPEEVRSFVEADGWMGGAAWFGEVGRDGTPASDSEWVVLLANDLGETKVVAVARTSGGEWTQTPPMRSLCGLGTVDIRGHDVRAPCTSVDLDAGPQNPMRGPGAPADLPTLPPAQLARAGLDHLHELAGRDGFERASVMMSMMPEFGAVIDIPPNEGHGQRFQIPVDLVDREALFVAATDERRWTVTTSFDDPALIRSEAADWTLSPDELAGAQPRVQAATAEALERTDLVGQAIGYGAVLLLVTGLLLRLVAALKGGMHLPLAAALYAKVTKDRSLDHERRQHLSALVDQEPGVALPEAARLLGLHRTVAFHHLDTLRRHGLVHEVRLGRTRHYVPAGLGAVERVWRAAMHHHAWREVLGELQQHPGVGVSELARRLGRDKSRVSRVTRRLEVYGLVRREPSGAGVVLYPALPVIGGATAPSEEASVP